MLDQFGMPEETVGPIVSNMEATVTMFQALRIYSWYKCGIAHPSGSEYYYMP